MCLAAAVHNASANRKVAAVVLQPEAKAKPSFANLKSLANLQILKILLADEVVINAQCSLSISTLIRGMRQSAIRILPTQHGRPVDRG